MQIRFHKNFVKNFDRRIKKNSRLLKRFKERYQLFAQDPLNPILKDHKPTGDMLSKRSFNITGDIRVVYRLTDTNAVEFLDIGTHPQVYG